MNGFIVLFVMVGNVVVYEQTMPSIEACEQAKHIVLEENARLSEKLRAEYPDIPDIMEHAKIEHDTTIWAVCDARSGDDR